MKIILIIIFCLIFTLSVAEASRSTTWSDNFEETLAYYWSNNSNITSPKCLTFACSGGNGWVAGLRNFNVQVDYYVKIMNLDTGTEINNGDSIPVGTRIKLDFMKHQNNHISWNGTGYSTDSPYGEWREDGTSAPQIDTCHEKDIVNFINQSAEKITNVYIPLVINAPNKSFSNLAGLTDCVDGNATDVDGKYKTCTVSSDLAGKTLSPIFNFQSTKGVFYYRYKLNNNCIGNNIALRRDINNTIRLGYTRVEDTAYFVHVPEKTISYNIKVFQPNRPPNAPTVNTSGNIACVGNNSTFTFQASDPDGDQVRYGIDWDNNGSVDQWVPSSGWVHSNTLQTATKSWAIIGNKTFKVLAQDKNGTNSAWVSKTITIPACPINGSCNNSILWACYAGVPNNGSDQVTWWKWSCDGQYGGTQEWCGLTKPINGDCGATNNACTAGNSVDQTDTATLYKWACNGLHGGTNLNCTLNKPINGDCGTAHNKVYPHTQNTYTPDIQCVQGSPSITTFPALGGTMTWTCSGQHGGASSNCRASRLSIPVDVCGNIGDFQGDIPTGLQQAGNNCVCPI